MMNHETKLAKFLLKYAAIPYYGCLIFIGLFIVDNLTRGQYWLAFWQGMTASWMLFANESQKGWQESNDLCQRILDFSQNLVDELEKKSPLTQAHKKH